MLNGDSNENGKKPLGLISKICTCSALFCTFLCLVLHDYNVKLPETSQFKVARYSFSGSIPPKFEHKLRRHKQGFGKVVTTRLY